VRLQENLVGAKLAAGFPFHVDNDVQRALRQRGRAPQGDEAPIAERLDAEAQAERRPVELDARAGEGAGRRKPRGDRLRFTRLQPEDLDARHDRLAEGRLHREPPHLSSAGRRRAD
jgi:hypothetical protein